jgi:hypothetical protein
VGRVGDPALHLSGPGQDRRAALGLASACITDSAPLFMYVIRHYSICTPCIVIHELSLLGPMLCFFKYFCRKI